MPFQGLTPESRVARADSKNPATTCKGITASGRPCRRSLAASAQASPSDSSAHGRGVVAISPRPQDTAAFFCWQHKDQADALAELVEGDVQVIDLQKRSSTDSLAARFGILNVTSGKGRKEKKGRKDEFGAIIARPHRRLTAPKLEPSEVNQPGARTSQQASVPLQRKRYRERGNTHVSLSCCMRASELPDSDDSPPTRPVRQAEMPHPREPSDAVRQTFLQTPQGTRQYNASRRPNLLSYLPQNAKPTTIAILSTELVKRLTPSDQEPGFIYIFWVVPSTSSKPSSSDASSLLSPPSRPGGERRKSSERKASELLRQYSVRAPRRAADGEERCTIMLKIGRAGNVHKRMNEWTRQCGEDIMLVRYYPYTGSSSPARSPGPSPGASPAARRTSSSMGPHKVPLVPRVERLIHLELQNQRVMRQCNGCRKQHREWFEVEGTLEGIKAVDETVRRWVQWGERAGHSDTTGK